MHKVLVLHGPNLNLIGSREPIIYGNTNLADIDNELRLLAISYNEKLTIEIECKQTNNEAVFIDYIHQAKVNNVCYLIINAAAFSHTSIAIRDALLAIAIPFIEVHISNIFKRESFRKKSYLSDIAVGSITGLGPIGYKLALITIITSILSNQY